MKTLAFLWWEDQVTFDRDRPFNKEWKCDDYAEYTEMLRDRDVDVICGEYRWYSDGKMKKAFRWNENEWEKVEDIEVDGVYDLFRHDEEKYEIKKKMKEEVGILNDPEVAELCQDKWRTYTDFGKYQAETRKGTLENVESMLETYDEVVLKPRYGSSGEGISRISDIEEFEKKEDMLVQRFIQAKAPVWMNTEGQHDMRVFVINGVIAGCHVRTPGEDTFLSNNAQGGDQFYLEISKIPAEVRDIITDVEEELEKYRPCIYTVDFMFDEKGKPWVVELNSQPGIYYHHPFKDKNYELPMMKKVVKALHELVEN